jgi:hypothetical protein
VRQAASKLMMHGRATIVTPSGEVMAQVIRFWRGDSVLDIEGEGKTYRQLSSNARMGQGLATRSLSRVSRDHLDMDHLIHCLVEVVNTVMDRAS